MDVTFLGGAGEVGRLGMVLEEKGTRLLLDYGLSPTKPPKLPMHASDIDYALLSHAHVDHSGMLPQVASRQDCQILATLPTIDVGLLLMSDSLKVMQAQGYREPYTKDDIKVTERLFDPVTFKSVRRIGPWEVHLHSAGHIPGATMYELRGDRTVLFTGDINTIDTRLVEGNVPVKCDVLVIEGTYAGRDHPKRAKIEYELLDKIEEVVSRGGKAILPAFAVGRTQELMLLLRKSGYEVWVDGMGKAVTQIYLDNPDYLRDSKKMRSARSEVRIVKGEGQRRQAMKGEVIVTTSGMLDGGPVIEYIQRMREDRESAVLLTGYQVEGTNGRLLMEQGRMNLNGSIQKVECEVGFYDLSAHAGHSQLVEFVHACKPEKVVIMHSESREVLAGALGDRYEILLPEMGKPMAI